MCISDGAFVMSSQIPHLKHHLAWICDIFWPPPTWRHVLCAQGGWQWLQLHDGIGQGLASCSSELLFQLYNADIPFFPHIQSKPWGPTVSWRKEWGSLEGAPSSYGIRTPLL